MSTRELLDLIACGIDPESQLFELIEFKLRIADTAVELAGYLKNSNVVDQSDRLAITTILELTKHIKTLENEYEYVD